MGTRMLVLILPKCGIGFKKTSSIDIICQKIYINIEIKIRKCPDMV